MVALEFVHPGGVEPDPVLTKAVATAAHAAGLIVLTCGIYGKVLRPQPACPRSAEASAASP